MKISRPALFQLFKYTVYVLLAMNVYWFFDQEFAAARLQFPDGVGLTDIIEAYASTIDTFAWVILLLMFELETYVLEDRHFTPAVTLSLHGLRAVCYAFIVYAFYGYVVNLEFHYGVSAMPDAQSFCALAELGWSYAIGIDEYVALTSTNCSTLSAAGELLRFDTMQVAMDAGTYGRIRSLAWIDVINAGVWLLVVLILEFDVRLQERGRLEGVALRSSNAAKVVLYSVLLFCAIYWGIFSDFVDFWDAFLWLVAFVFIELNVFEWRQEELQSQD